MLALTARQEQILNLIDKDFNYTEIGELLGIRESTVRAHLERIKDRLGVKDVRRFLWRRRVEEILKEKGIEERVISDILEEL